MNYAGCKSEECKSTVIQMCTLRFYTLYLACDIVKTPLMPTGGDIKPGVAMTNVLSRMATRRHDHVQNGLSLGRSQVKIMRNFTYSFQL